MNMQTTLTSNQARLKQALIVKLRIAYTAFCVTKGLKLNSDMAQNIAVLVDNHYPVSEDDRIRELL